MIAETESQIVELLKDALPLVNVEAFPDNPTEYKLLHNKGAVLVAYKGRSSESVTDCGLSCSEYEFNVNFLFRNLRQRDGHQGVYPSLETAESALKGFLRLSSERFVGFENGVWEYSQLYRLNNIG